ncbi:MAG: UDP-2,3-diacylglucosamine diphosphatase [Desulfuromonas sp.]|nr:UDP-2,3-diacylglucosamine diphosphatase [Desulfuromonas sp.]
MRAVFLADAHLRQPSDDNYRALLSFLTTQEGRIDLLVLLGDICEFLVGYPGSVFPPYVPLFEALARLEHSGTRIVYVEGNHDFHLEPSFRNRFPCRVLPDGGIIDLAGRQILVVHGDMANPADHGYRRLRFVLRSRPLRLLIRLLPAAWTWAIAERMSLISKRSRNDKSRRWPARDILIPYAQAQFAAGCQAVVAGHFHQPFHEKLTGGELIALGDWITQYSYASWEDGEFRLEAYRSPID